MILVDTSVLVDFLKGMNNKGTQSLDYIIDSGIPYDLTVSGSYSANRSLFNYLYILEVL